MQTRLSRIASVECTGLLKRDGKTCCDIVRVYNYTQTQGLVKSDMDSGALIRLLKQNGWREVRVAGSHHTFKHPEFSMILTVPHPKKDLPLGTANSILKKAGLK